MNKTKEKFRVNTIEVDMGNVIPNNWNPKDAIKDNPVNEERFSQIKKGVVEYGLMMPITVRETENGIYEIIDGYHRYQACKELGYTKLLVNNLGKIKDEVAKSLTILFERAKVEPNSIMEAELLKNIYETIPSFSEMAKLLPFDAEMIESKIALIEHDWDQQEESTEDEKGEEDSVSFLFRTSVEDSEICNKALLLVGEDRESSFVEICHSYIKMKEGVDEDAAVEASQIPQEEDYE